MSEHNIAFQTDNVANCLSKAVSGKEFRYSLRKPVPNYGHEVKTPKVRVVPAFTIQALQKNTKVLPPPRFNMYSATHTAPTRFSKCYLRGDLPMSIGYAKAQKAVAWSKPVDTLDAYFLLPLFFEGLTEETYPYNFLIEKGLNDLKPKPHEVISMLPELAVSVRKALNTKKPLVICRALKCLQILVKTYPGVGEALIPHYRKILPILNLFYGIPRHQWFIPNREENHETMVEDTLKILEEYGGPSAFCNIKYNIPTYESCTMNM